LTHASHKVVSVGDPTHTARCLECGATNRNDDRRLEAPCPNAPKGANNSAPPLARLIAKTMPLPEVLDLYSLDADQFVAYVARVSNPANQHNHETAPKLLSYLRRNQHWSPFEMAHAVIEINTTRDIARQILRHRSFSFQEFSQRYSSDIQFAAPRGTRMQDPKNRQNSLEGTDPFVDRWWEAQQKILIGAVRTAYETAIQHGVAKEVARSILPEGLTMSRLYMSGSLRSWLHYLDLRTGNGTQMEHRMVAEACKAELVRAFPSIFAPGE
jgi:thymidylate synthase (FAD)